MDWTIVEGYFHFQLRENLYNFVLPSLLLACGSREPTSMNTLLNLVIGGCVCVCSIDDSWLHPCSGDSSWSLCWMSCSSGGQSADCGLCCVSATGQWRSVFQDWCPGGELSISGMNSLARVLWDLFCPGGSRDAVQVWPGAETREYGWLQQRWRGGGEMSCGGLWRSLAPAERTRPD